MRGSRRGLGICAAWGSNWLLERRGGRRRARLAATGEQLSPNRSSAKTLSPLRLQFDPPQFNIGYSLGSIHHLPIATRASLAGLDLSLRRSTQEDWLGAQPARLDRPTRRASQPNTQPANLATHRSQPKLVGPEYAQLVKPFTLSNALSATQHYPAHLIPPGAISSPLTPTRTLTLTQRPRLQQDEPPPLAPRWPTPPLLGFGGCGWPARWPVQLSLLDRQEQGRQREQLHLLRV